MLQLAIFVQVEGRFVCTEIDVRGDGNRSWSWLGLKFEKDTTERAPKKNILKYLYKFAAAYNVCMVVWYVSLNSDDTQIELPHNFARCPSQYNRLI